MNTHLDRYLQVAEVLTRHGLGFVVRTSGLDRWARFQRLPGQARRQPHTTPETVRLVLEELGPTFIKLGQLLSTRSDLVPPAYQHELSKLQDSAPRVPGDTVRELIRAELGAPPEELFAEFDIEPLASASIGQAHAATLHDGTAVVVKVRRPGVVERVEEDLEILQNMAAVASSRSETLAGYDLTGITTEFSHTLRAELDYLREGRNAERFAQHFAAHPDVHIPAIYWATTTSRVLTMERIRGIKVNDTRALDDAGIDRRALATRACEAAARMILDDGFFHADPHPGNLFIEPGGRIALIDFGMVGEVDEKLRGQLANLLVAVSRNDPDRITSALVAICESKHSVDRRRLRADLKRLLYQFRDRELGDIDVGAVISQLLGILRAHRLRLPREAAMLLKMILTIEGMGVTLDPGFRVGEALAPYARQLALERFSPQVLAKRLGQAGMDAAELGAELPEILRRIFDLIDSDSLEVHLRAAELEPMVERVERIGNRLVAGIIAGALIRGIGELTVGKDRWRDWDGPLIGAGLGTVGAAGAYLAWTGRPTRRRRSLR